MEVHTFLLQLMVILLAARTLSEVATRLRAPAVMGELFAAGQQGSESGGGGESSSSDSSEGGGGSAEAKSAEADGFSDVANRAGQLRDLFASRTAELAHVGQG